jgi:hypothetical protein
MASLVFEVVGGSQHMVRNFHFTVLRVVGSAVVLAVLGGLFPSKATAGCGDDYIVVTENKNRPEHKSAESPTHTKHDHQPILPCHGPNCSKQSVPLPFAPLPAPSTVSVDVKAFLAEHVAQPDSGPRFVFALSSEEDSVACGSSIFDPPRC